jgi:hypothetical protein
MSRRRRRLLLAGALGAGATISNQALEIGGKTLSSAGDFKPLDSRGNLVDVVSITSQVGATRTWSVSSGAIIANGTPAVDHGIVLAITTAIGSCNLTINSTGTDADGRNLANTWSVSTIDELTAAANHASLALGDNILLRDGAYNTAQDVKVIARSGAPTGSWTPPSLIDAAHPDKGSDLDSSNFVVIAPHAGASPVIHYLYVNGINQAAQYLRFTDLEFFKPPLGPVSASYVSAFEADNGATHIAIDHCTISSNDDIEEARELQAYTGVTIIGDNIWVRDNLFQHCITGAKLIGDNIEYVGNDSRTCWIDWMFCDGSDILHAWNEFRNIRLVSGGAHVDLTQLNNSDATRTNVKFKFNRQWIGDGELDNDAQGIFGGNNPASFTEGSEASGNLLVLATFNALYLTGFQDAVMNNNTVIADPAAYATRPASLGFLRSGGCTARFNIYNNVANGDPTSPNTFSNNMEIADTDYAATFVSPQSMTAVTDLAAQYDINPGVYATGTANYIPGANSTYIDWDNREHDFPWEETGFDANVSYGDETNVSLSGAVVSDKIQVSGASATGTFLEVSGGVSPTLTIYASDGSTVIASGVANYVATNGQYYEIHDVGSDVGATETVVTVAAGTTSGEWSITTTAAGFTAVTFDGTNDYLNRGAGFTGAANGEEFTFVIRFHPNDTGAVQVLLHDQQDNIKIQLSATNTITGYMWGAAERIGFVSVGSVPNADGMITLFFSGKTTSGDERIKMFKGSTDITPAGGGFYNHTAGTMDFTATDWKVFANNAGSLKFSGDVEFIWFDTVYYDVSDSAVRAKFAVDQIGADGSGPGARPLLYLTGAASLWNASPVVNLGDGGNLTMNGAVV